MDLPLTAEQFFGAFADDNRTFSGSAAMLLAVPTDCVLLGAGVLLATLRIRQGGIPAS